MQINEVRVPVIKSFQARPKDDLRPFWVHHRPAVMGPDYVQHSLQLFAPKDTDGNEAFDLTIDLGSNFDGIKTLVELLEAGNVAIADGIASVAIVNGNDLDTEALHGADHEVCGCTEDEDGEYPDYCECTDRTFYFGEGDPTDDMTPLDAFRTIVSYDGNINSATIDQAPMMLRSELGMFGGAFYRTDGAYWGLFDPNLMSEYWLESFS